MTCPRAMFSVEAMVAATVAPLVEAGRVVIGDSGLAPRLFVEAGAWDRRERPKCRWMAGGGCDSPAVATLAPRGAARGPTFGGRPMCGPHLHRMTASGHVVDRWLTTVVRFPDPVLVSPTPELVAAVRVLSAAIGQRMIEMAVGAVL